MRASKQSFLLMSALLVAAMVGSCGGKVEVGGQAGAAGKAGGTGGFGGSNTGGYGGTSPKGGSGGAATGGYGQGGGDGFGGWGGSGQGGWGGNSKGGSSGYGGGDGIGGWGGAGNSGGADGAGAWGGSGWGGSGWGGGDGTGGVGGQASYGVITDVKFSTPFLLDANQINDNNYIQQHGEGVIYVPGFFGYFGWGSKPIPPATGQSIGYGVHSPAQGGSPASVQVTQYSLLNNSDVVNPFLQLSFASDKVLVGPVDVGYSMTSQAYLVLYNSLQQGNDYCVLAIAVGSLEILQAENTTAQDGGKLAIAGSYLPLYYPTQTPYGDISSSLGKVCPQE
jgi:hypothetical protein